MEQPTLMTPVPVCLNEQLQELVVVLGDDVKELRMRVGIHAGPVTAGVLRGERACFQLYGDTVNVASRIESKVNGVASELSVATAKHLSDCPT